MKEKLIRLLQKLFHPFLIAILSNPIERKGKTNQYYLYHSQKSNCTEGKGVRLMHPYYIDEVEIGDYTYISKKSHISQTNIGKFCSIGPNFMCGIGIHQISGISTSPMFYSTMKQNGFTLSKEDKIQERKKIIIGNDVFIGANVTILDGVTIGDGAVIGASALVNKDILPYAITVGVPAKIIKFRFSEKQIEELLKIQWWNFNDDKLQDIEEYFFDIDLFIEKYSK
ncbi:MAG: CatB-related O-acetyltransferase [Bacteroidales bacterium]|jgi:acetyltransferase-like isoleucine patch superfamily enzyme